jgi:tRNA-specific 2-thiouridylase
MNKKVVIGLSGGVDSSVAALLLKERGFDVFGLHFSFSDEKYADNMKKLSDQLIVPISVVDISDDFEVVKEHFVNEYLRGRTPSPCTFCNRVIKWKKLIDFADNNDIEFIASGHYIRKVEKNGFWYLKKGIDTIKDQSYFLWELNSNTIKRMVNPLGDYTKEEVRQIAAKYGFKKLSKQKESMGVCFLQNMDYRAYIQKNYPKKISSIKPGKVKNMNGEVIGSHQGYIHYTIGQKRGMNLKIKDAAYVIHIDSNKNELVVAPKHFLNKSNIRLSSLHLINPQVLRMNDEIDINVRGYGLNPKEPAVVKKIDSKFIELELRQPAWAIAPGQPVVFYHQDMVIGGGIAEKSW